jgi:ABC-type transport system involved in multi-copper enzyme maturation permease subunit
VSTAVTADVRTGRDTRPGLARLTKVELRKMVDTRSGFWLLLAVAALMLLVVVVVQIAGNDHDRTLREVLSATVQTGAVLLPVVGILLVTAEWGQRTALVTFALVPGRARVILAKVLAGLALALVAFLVALVLAAIGVAVGASGVDDAWSLPLSLLGQDVLYVVVAMLTGLAFGTALLSSAPAIVLYFGLPIAIGALGAISAISGTIDWLDTGAFAPLTEEVVSGEQWAQAGTAALLWIALPLAIGLWRIRRDEVK